MLLTGRGGRETPLRLLTGTEGGESLSRFFTGIGDEARCEPLRFRVVPILHISNSSSLFVRSMIVGFAAVEVIYKA